jgi:hypothetical protein
VQLLAARVGGQGWLQVGGGRWVGVGEEPAGDCEKAVVVLRPGLVKAGVAELVVNLFRINGFGIISRRQKVLSKEFIERMAKL